VIDKKLPFVRELARNYVGIDPVEQPIPVRPVVHYMMGGVDTDVSAATVLPGLFAPARIPRQVPVLSLAYALLLVAGFMGLIALDDAAQAAAGGVEPPLQTQVMQVLAASLAMLPSLFAVGLVISLLLRAHTARVNRLYGADLVGGSVGCLLVLPLMRYVGGDHGIFVIASMAAAGSALLAHAHARRGTFVAGTLDAAESGVTQAARLPVSIRPGVRLSVRLDFALPAPWPLFFA